MYVSNISLSLDFQTQYPNSHSIYPHNMFKLRSCYLLTLQKELPLILGKIFNCNLILMLKTETCISLTLLSPTFHLQTIINFFKFTFKICVDYNDFSLLLLIFLWSKPPVIYTWCVVNTYLLLSHLLLITFISLFAIQHPHFIKI